MEIAPAVATVTEVIKVTMPGSRAGAQGSVPPWMVATPRVVSVEAVTVSSCSQEHGISKDKENGLSQEVAAVLGVLKKEVIGLH